MNRFIIADPQKCIGCRTCEVACVMAHQVDGDLNSLNIDNFSPRIHVVKGYNVSTAIVCRQCEDAPCANVCPNGAISRRDDFIYVSQEKCIGCKTCVVACPYGTMEVVNRVLPRQEYALASFSTKSEANKCDLCHTRDNGPACIETCPTEALRCMDPNVMQNLLQEKRRRAALDTTVV